MKLIENILKKCEIRSIISKNCRYQIVMLNQWLNWFCNKKKGCIFAPIGEMAEWSNAAVLKTVEGHTSGGSNPSFSALENQVHLHLVFCFYSCLCLQNYD